MTPALPVASQTDSTPGETGGPEAGPTPPAATRVDRWRRARSVAFVAYFVAYVVWFVKFGIIIDRISVLLSVAVLLVIGNLGRPGRTWGRAAADFVMYAAMWIAYDETRGAADRVGLPLQAESVRAIDRALFFGADPTVWMQQQFFSADHVRWYDIVASVVYYSHFVVPVAVIAYLWVRDRTRWVRFMCRFATVLAVACISFVLLPTAPPWMAAGGSKSIPLDLLPPLARPAGRGWDALHLDSFVHAWETGRDWANPTAAMPSLHAAFSLFIVAFWFPAVRRRSVRAALLGYPIAMGVSLVYLAEHWVIDVLAGWAVVAASFGIWHLVDRRRSTSAAAAAPVGHDHDLGGSGV